MIKILIFSGVPINDSASFFRSGQLAKYLEPTSYQVIFLSVSNNYKKKETLEFKGLRVTFIGQAHYFAKKNFSGRQRINFSETLINNFKTTLSFLEILLKEKPDRVLVVTTMPISLFCGFFSRMFGFKTIIDIEDYALGQMASSVYPPILVKFYEFMEKILLKSFSKIIVCSEFLKNTYTNSIMIPNMVDLKIWDRKKFENKNIAFVGYMGKYHGQEEFLEEIVAYIVNKQIKVYFIGAGEMEGNLKRLVKKLRIEKNVYFTGQLAQEKVAEILQNCRVGVLPLWDKPVHQARHPLKLLEYLASGLIVVSNEVGEVGRIIEDGYNGYLCQAGDIKSLAKKSIEILNNNINPRISINAKNTAKNFSINKVMHLWEASIN